MTDQIKIVRASVADSELLAIIGRQSFIESHGHSAAKEDIDHYIATKLSADFFREDISDPGNIYHIIFYGDEPAGYSKIILNFPQPDIEQQHVTKLERIYLLAKFFPFKLGQALFNFNLQLSKSQFQSGMWLFVWKENQRAFKFYARNGFRIIGEYDFQVSATHSNPNWKMLLVY